MTEHSPARERVLAAAISLFSRSSFDETSLRDIAARAQVDVAYVHRCYGSKEKLFARALNVSMRPGRVFETDEGDIAKAFARDVFSTAPAPSAEARFSDIGLRSLSSAAARVVLKEMIAADLVAPLADRMSNRSELRAVLLVAAVAGIRLFRDVLEFEALQEGPGGQLEAAVEDLLRHIMRPAPAPVPNSKGCAA
ncbi:TetR family transcriptional regulator [Hansschlegelia sp. KR7-227]|uniref:TetR family transcriptional regulator n=1 Tax=Hansschlegelia sp. KR7-227 TaxID=3400914 RepID=UPI003C08D965